MNTYVLCEQRQQKQTCYSEHGKAQVAILNNNNKKRTAVNYGNARVGEIFLPREDHTNSVSITKHLSLKIYMQVTSGRMSRFYLYI